MPKRLFPVLRLFAVSSPRPADQAPTNVFSGKTWMKVAPEQSGWSVHADTLAGQGDSEKLVVLEVSFGDHQRTVLAGMKWERANPREIEGKQALFVGNLPPRKWREWFPKAPSSTSVIRTELLRCWRPLRRVCQTEAGRDKC